MNREGQALLPTLAVAQVPMVISKRQKSKMRRKRKKPSPQNPAIIILPLFDVFVACHLAEEKKCVSSRGMCLVLQVKDPKVRFIFQNIDNPSTSVCLMSCHCIILYAIHITNKRA